MAADNFYEGLTTELMEPMTKEGLRGAIRYIHSRIAENKPIKGMYKNYLLEALDKIAKGSNPDTAFKFRQHQTKPSREPRIMDAMQEIYNRNTKGTKITAIIMAVANDKRITFGYETLKKEWYKDDCAWEKGFNAYYEAQNEAQREYFNRMRQKASE